MLAQTGAIIPVRQTRAGRKKFVISHTDLLTLRATQDSMVQLKTAARYIGMSTRRIEALVNAGLIASIGVRIDKRSIDNLLGSIAAVCASETVILAHPISLAEALRLYVPLDASASFFDRLVNGVVRLVSSTNEVLTLHNIIVDRSDVVAAMKEPPQLESQMSIVDAAHRLGIKQEVMYHLINIGLIKARVGKLRRRPARVVDIADLKEFSKKYQPLVAVAKSMGVSTREAPNWAWEQGIQIVSGPSVDGGRQYWIRRPAGTGITHSAIHEV